jgi:hypothetical protein
LRFLATERDIGKDYRWRSIFEAHIHHVTLSGILRLLLIIFAQEATAQQSAIASQAAQFLQSKFNRDAISESIRNYSKALPSRCKELEIGTKVNVLVFTPLQFSPDGRRLIAGAWKEQVTVRACGIERLYNVLTNLRSDGGLQRTNLLLGTTRSDPVLQRDAVVYAMGSATLKAPAGCKSFDVLDTAFLGHDAASQASGAKGRDMRPWRENWTTQACDVETVVLMTFTPDATGTTIAATTDRKPK